MSPISDFRYQVSARPVLAGWYLSDLSLIACQLSLLFSHDESQIPFPRDYDEGNAEQSDEDSSEEGHAEEGEIQLTSQQMVEQGLKVAVASTGLVEKLTTLPGKLVEVGSCHLLQRCG